MDRVIESDISSEMRRIVDMRDEDDTSGECYVLVARPGNGG